MYVSGRPLQPDEARTGWIEGPRERRKHGAGFGDASTAFTDYFGRLIPDPDHSAGEERFILLGMNVHRGLLVVCHSEPVVDTIRIISARNANPHERSQYEESRNA